MMLSGVRAIEQPDPVPRTEHGDPVFQRVPAREQAFGVLETAITSAGFVGKKDLPSTPAILQSLALFVQDDTYTHEAQQVMRGFFLWPQLLPANDITYALEWDDEDDRVPGIEAWIEHLVVHAEHPTTVVHTLAEIRVLEEAISTAASVDNVPLTQALVAIHTSHGDAAEPPLYEVLKGAAYRGNVQLMQWAATKFRNKARISRVGVREIMETAASWDQVQSLEWMRQNYAELFDKNIENIASAAAEGFGTNVLAWLHQNTQLDRVVSSESWMYIIIQAAERRKWNNVRWILETYSGVSALLQSPIFRRLNNIWYYITFHGDVQVMEWVVPLTDALTDATKSSLMLGAAGRGDVPILEKYQEENSAVEAFQQAAKYGRLAACKWLQAKFPDKIDESVLYSAIQLATIHGQVHIMEYIIHEVDYVLDEEEKQDEKILKLAAEHGQTYALQWALDNANMNVTSKETADDMLSSAVSGNYIDTAQYIVEKFDGVDKRFKLTNVSLDNLEEETFLWLAYKVNTNDYAEFLERELANEIPFDIASIVLRRMASVPSESFLRALFLDSRTLNKYDMLRLVRDLSFLTIQKHGNLLVNLTAEMQPLAALHVLAPNSPYVREESGTDLVRISNNPAMPEGIRAAARIALLSLIRESNRQPAEAEEEEERRRKRTKNRARLQARVKL